MTFLNELKQLYRPRVIFMRALQGAAIAFILINVLVFIAQEQKMKYENWQYIDIGAVTLCGFLGGILYSLMSIVRLQGGKKKLIVNVISVLGLLFICYFSLILSLHAIGQWH